MIEIVEYHTFISYSHDDRSFVNKLVDDLKRANLTIWYDANITPGTRDWEEAISKAIRASKAVVLVATRTSRESLYVRSELELADKLNRPIYPIWGITKDPWHDSIRLNFILMQYVDFTDYDKGFQQLLELVKEGRATPVKADSAVQEVAVTPPVSGKKVSSETYHASLDTLRQGKDESAELFNRRSLIWTIDNFWLQTVLKPSLHEAVSLELGVEQQNALVQWTKVLADEDYPSATLSPGTKILDIFDRTGKPRTLLITGNPGAGKTTKLLELAQDSITRLDPRELTPTPVVLSLSSWKSRQADFAAWLVDDIEANYHLPRTLVEKWIQEEKLLLLLDGLDEVELDRRDACVTAINQFRQNHANTDMVVCSRFEDYRALKSRLNFAGAVYIQPLTDEQVNHYLAGFGAKTSGLRNMLGNDPQMRELISTPLMLNILMLVYDGNSAVFDTLKTPQAIRRYLLQEYVTKVLYRGQKPYSDEETIQWLHWLANEMAARGISTFLIERLQPNALPSAQTKRVFGGVFRGLFIGIFVILVIAVGIILQSSGTIIAGSFAAGAIAIVLNLLAMRMPTESDKDFRPVVTQEVSHIGFRFTLAAGVAGVIAGLLLGIVLNVTVLENPPLEFTTLAKCVLLTALFSATVSTILRTQPNIRTVEKLMWSYGKAWSYLRKQTLFITIVGLLITTFLMLTTDPRNGLVLGMGFTILLIMILSLLGGVVPSELPGRNQPNEGVWQSMRNGWLGSVLVGVMFGTMSSMIAALIGGLSSGLQYGVLVGGVSALLAWLMFGGGTGLRHSILRLFLTRTGAMPLNYRDFLTYACERTLLQRAGGGYRFLHRELQEYFQHLNLKK